MWTRRSFLATLLGTLSTATGGKEREREGAKGGRPSPLYGLVEAVEGGGLWVAGRYVEAAGGLWPYLAPGMAVRVEGRRVQVVEPRVWAYFQGPGSLVGLAGDRVRVWWAEGRPWKVLRGTAREGVLVARFAEGVWQGLPPPFTLSPPPRKGWWRWGLRGGVWALEAFLEE